MRSTYKQLFYINRSKIKADGTTAIMCRVTIDGKAAVLTAAQLQVSPPHLLCGQGRHQWTHAS